jgi:hypothetical protein
MPNSRSKRKSSRSKRSKSTDRFYPYLKKKISENIKEYKKGRWVSPQQAVAVSYSQARKKYPNTAGARKSLRYLKQRKQKSKK